MKNPCGCEFDIKARGPFPWLKYKKICLQHSQEYFIIVVNDLIERTYRNAQFQLKQNILSKQFKDNMDKYINLQKENKKDRDEEDKMLKDNKKAHDEFMKFFFSEDEE